MSKSSNFTFKHGLLSKITLTLALVLSLASLNSCGKKETPDEKFTRLISEAKAFKSQGKLDEARIKFQNAIDVKQNDAVAYYELGEIFTEQKLFNKALPSYQTALNLNPEFRDARLRIATYMAAAGEFEQVESHVAKLLEKDAEDVEALLLSASINSARNKNDQARDILNKVLQAHPDNAAALASLGDIYQREGKSREAEEYFKRALEKEPNSEPIRIALADLYSRLGRFKDAEDIVTAVLNDNPRNTSLRFYFADFLLERGLLERALSQYQQVLAADPLRLDARDRLVDNYIARQEPEKARKLLTEYIEGYPKEQGADYFRGRLAQLDKKYDEALQSFIKAIAGMTTFAPAFRHAGLAELALGKQSEGIEHLNQAVAIDPFDVGARLTLARDAFFKRDFSTASEHINKILARHPRQIGANIVRADLALVQGDLKTAEAIYKVLVETFPNSPAPYFKLALLSEKAERKEDAINYYKKAISLDKDPFISLNRLARLLVITNGFDTAIKELTSMRDQSANAKADFDVVLGYLTRSKANATPEDYAAARALFEEALKEKPQFLPAYFALAEMDRFSGDLDQAIQRYKKVIEVQPKHAPSYMLLALTYEAQGNYTEAGNVYRKVLNLVPTFAPAANNLAWNIAEQTNGNLDEALRLAQVAKQEMPNEASIADTLGWVYYKQGSLKAAYGTLEEAVQLDQSNENPNPEIIFHLAVVADALGLRDEAVQSINKALTLAGEKHPKKAEMEQLKSRLDKNK